MKPLVLTTVTTLGGILKECLLSGASSLWGSASESRIWVSGRFLSACPQGGGRLGEGDWEAGLSASTGSSPAEPTGQAFGRRGQLSGWPCLLAKEPHGNRSPSQQTDGSRKFSVLRGALGVSPRLPSGHAAPGPSHHHHLPLEGPRPRARRKYFQWCHGGLSSEEISAPHHMASPTPPHPHAGICGCAKVTAMVATP